MKKIISLLLIIVTILSFASCKQEASITEPETTTTSDPNKITVVNITPTSNIVCSNDYKITNLSGNILGDEARFGGWSYYYHDSNLSDSEVKYWKPEGNYFTSLEVYFNITNISKKAQKYKNRFKGYIIHNAPKNFNFEKAFDEEYLKSLSNQKTEIKEDVLEIFKIHYLQDNPNAYDNDNFTIRSTNPVALGPNENATQILLADVSYEFFYNWSGENRENTMYLVFTYGNNMIYYVDLKTVVKENIS